MSLALLFTQHVQYGKLSPEFRAQFQAEQQCSLGVAGLPAVRRVFVGGAK